MDTAERVRSIVAPLLADTTVELIDVVHTGGTLRVTIDQPGGLDLDVISRVTRQVSRALDDVDPLPGRYTLEVSSPGLERPLRTPEHFRRAVGSTVVVKAVAGVEGDRRFSGVLAAVDDDGIVVRDGATLTERRLGFDEIEKARTSFEWGPTPKPGGPKDQRNQPKKAAAR